MTFAESVIGTPYNMHNINGLSCWGLVALYYGTKNVSLPNYRINSLDVREITRAFTEAFNSGDHGFKPTDTPKDYDVVVFKSNIQWHCGLLLNKKVLHSTPKYGVIYQNLKDITGFNHVEYWTYDKD